MALPFAAAGRRGARFTGIPGSRGTRKSHGREGVGKPGAGVQGAGTDPGLELPVASLNLNASGLIAMTVCSS
jgi:hypothetical protein